MHLSIRLIWKKKRKAQINLISIFHTWHSKLCVVILFFLGNYSRKFLIKSNLIRQWWLISNDVFRVTASLAYKPFKSYWQSNAHWIYQTLNDTSSKYHCVTVRSADFAVSDLNCKRVCIISWCASVILKTRL